MSVYGQVKKNKEVEMAWVKMEWEEAVEEELGATLPGDWSILKAEISGIDMAIRDMRRGEGSKIVVFSDSASGLTMITDMEKGGESSSLLDMIADRLNE